MITNVQDITDLLENVDLPAISIAAGQDDDVMRIIKLLQERFDTTKFTLTGDSNLIFSLIKQFGINRSSIQILHCANEDQSAVVAVEQIKNHNCAVLMKGCLQTSTFIRSIVNKEHGLLKHQLISQVTICNNPNGNSIQLLTDCAMAINPTLEQKISIIENAVELARALGIEKPRVAAISAVELVNSKMEDTIDGAILSKMAERGQIDNCYVDGPLALDNAVSPAAASHKGINGPVAGKADILLFPNLQTGNAVFKTLLFYAKIPMAAVVMGASNPIVMTSRTDSIENKLLSIYYALYLKTVLND